MSELTEKNKSVQFTTRLTDYLNGGKLAEVTKLFKDYEDIIDDTSWEIVPIISSHLTLKNMKYNKELFACCEILLDVVAEKSNPSDTVLNFLEQAECLEDDTKFFAILKPLSKSFYKMSDKTKAIEWCVSTMRSYVESLYLLEKGELNQIELSKNSNSTVDRLLIVWSKVVSFFVPLIEETALTEDATDKILILRNYVLSFLIYILGKPFCYIQECTLKSADSEEILPEKIISYIFSLTGDPLRFLHIAKNRHTQGNSKKKYKIDNEIQYNLQTVLFESAENVPTISYANFYYYIITRDFLWEKVPQVYHPHYVFQMCTYLIKSLLREQGYVLVSKGLNFMDCILKKITKCSIEAEVLQLSIYSELFDTIINVMIYHDNDLQRKQALSIFQEYIEVFNMQARYLIIQHLYQTTDYSGLLSLITSIFKSFIIECLEAKPVYPDFLGTNMESLLKLACKLPHGSASDLVEILDEVITSVNLLRFLFIRDQSNETGIWNIVDTLEISYLKPLREGIHFCKSHWRVKLKDLQAQSKMHGKMYDQVEVEKADIDITLTVGGERLPAMPIAEKINVCYQAINGLDVLESILVRTNECIINNPLKKSEKNSDFK